jgi:hypothetical protein
VTSQLKLTFFPEKYLSIYGTFIELHLIIKCNCLFPPITRNFTTNSIQTQNMKDHQILLYCVISDSLDSIRPMLRCGTGARERQNMVWERVHSLWWALSGLRLRFILLKAAQVHGL